MLNPEEDRANYWESFSHTDDTAPVVADKSTRSSGGASQDHAPRLSEGADRVAWRR